jgi:[acyl-carrier-protein] S-malonyltransferase
MASSEIRFKRAGDALQAELGSTAFAFRGYNLTNMGRTPELLAHPVYGPTVARYLRQAGKICEQETNRPVDLVRRVAEDCEPGLEAYAEAVALIMAVELAHIQLLEEFHGVYFGTARLAYGYSLGELTTLACAGVVDMNDVMRVPIAIATDAAELAANTKMGILFSRGPAIPEADVHRLCREITSEGDGVIGVSSILSPNTYLVLGQGNRVQRFKETMHETLPPAAHLRIHPEHWPPMHTPIVRQKFVPDRASVMMDSMRGGFVPPNPPIISLVTGKRSYDEAHARELLRNWADHPQRLWDAVYETLACGATTVVHVGPAPNLIPATFHRLAENVVEQSAGNSLGSLGMRAAAGLARRPWLSALLPSRAALLRAPHVKHVILEDWLLEHGRHLT